MGEATENERDHRKPPGSERATGGGMEEDEEMRERVRDGGKA